MQFTRNDDYLTFGMSNPRKWYSNQETIQYWFNPRKKEVFAQALREARDYAGPLMACCLVWTATLTDEEIATIRQHGTLSGTDGVDHQQMNIIIQTVMHGPTI